MFKNVIEEIIRDFSCFSLMSTDDGIIIRVYYDRDPEFKLQLKWLSAELAKLGYFAIKISRVYTASDYSFYAIYRDVLFRKLKPYRPFQKVSFRCVGDSPIDCGLNNKTILRMPN